MIPTDGSSGSGSLRWPEGGAPVPTAVGELLGRTAFPRPGTELTCAVSGGPDSLALLVLAVAAGCRVTAVHVDHGLREGSADEADVARRAADRFGAAFRAEQVAVPPGPNLEARARAARASVLPPGAATGHTADDQAETVLLNLLRGSGLSGLAAMRPGPTHPLLALRRAETHALCAEVGLTPVVDPSNADLAQRRNRIRHEVVPLLDAVAGRDVVPLLARAADHARAADDQLDAFAAALDPTDAAGLAAAPVELARRAVRTWLRRCSADGRPPDRATVERVLAVARGEARATDAGAGWTVERHRQRLSLTAPRRS